MAAPFPNSIAIAGAWGYIGRKFLEASQLLQLRTTVHDPGPVPADVDLENIVRVHEEAHFYHTHADLFHLALHPEHRPAGMSTLLERGGTEPILVLCEKPIATPERPAGCRETVDAIRHSGAVVLYDFPELFDPITYRILEFFGQFREVAVHSIQLLRSKDREDPANPRNYKRMVHIQYQESVHCLAWVLYLLAGIRGGIEDVFTQGMSIDARSQRYEAPNPNDYPYVVDGRCRFHWALGPVQIQGLTDFKRGARWAKTRLVHGVVDGQPFEIKADYLEGKKRLVINGVAQEDVTDTNSYLEVITSCGRLYRSVPKEELKQGLYPNAAFAHLTYQLSSALWRSCWQEKVVVLDSRDHLLAFDAEFASTRQYFPRYE